jgi:hypothetical protein
MPADSSDKPPRTPWFLSPHLLWFALAVVVLTALWPTLVIIIKSGAISKVGIGPLQLEFIQNFKQTLEKVRGFENQPISAQDREHLTARYQNIIDKARGTSDQLPAKNGMPRYWFI